MNPHLVFVFVTIVLPFAVANYGHSQHGGYDYSQGSYDGNSVEEILIAAATGNCQSGASRTAGADVGYEPHAQANGYLHILNANPSYQHRKSCYSTADSLAHKNLAPNVLNNHQLITTRRMQPVAVNQPKSPSTHISSGPAAVGRADPVVYKLKPSLIYQQEIVKDVPAPLSLNPVYVKLLKQGNQADASIPDPPRCGHQATSFTVKDAAFEATASQLDTLSGGYGTRHVINSANE